jgi:hypothetical protein
VTESAIVQNASHFAAWTWYLIGAVITLLWKLVRYLRTNKRNGIPVWEAFGTWVFEDSLDNTISWTTTIGAVWVFGSIWIEKVWDIGIITSVPVHNSLAFFFGGLMELVAPEVAKQIARWIRSVLPGGNL